MPEHATRTLAWSRVPLAPANLAGPAEIAERCARPAFGQVLTEHTVGLSWSEDRGWHEARLRAWAPLVLDPASVCLHYGQIVFEGLKAFRRADGTAAVFRAADHARRLRGSARRLAMPELPEEHFLEAVRELVAQDERWVPAEPGRSLYLRPLIYAADIGLALRPSRSYEFLLLAFVTESFFGAGTDPVAVWICEKYARAARGGTGEAKCAGNYAPGYLAQAEAAAHGCQQVVWLDDAGREEVEEMGGMNLCFIYGEGANARLVTPPLGGTILPGVTRDSLLLLAADLGLPVEERSITVAEWRRDAESGEMTEAFACGTAASVTAIGRVVSASGEWVVGDGRTGLVTARLAEMLVGIQRGLLPDRHGWLEQIDARTEVAASATGQGTRP